MLKRNIEWVVNRSRLGEEDDGASVRYWLSQPVERRILEVEALRRMWIEQLGDPDRPMMRVIARRKLDKNT